MSIPVDESFSNSLVSYITEKINFVYGGNHPRIITRRGVILGGTQIRLRRRKVLRFW